ncbi:MAG: AMP-binding protein [Firmicutes bacterium]|nr:AMP-binding protein [Bacillota bacterium]
MVWRPKLYDRLSDIAGKTVGAIIRENASQFGDETVLITEDSEMTWSGFARTIESVALGFLSLDIAPGERIAIIMPNREEVVLSYFAAATVGALSVPINPALKDDEITYLFNHCTPRLVITDAEHLAMLRSLANSGTISKPIMISVEKEPFFDARAWTELLTEHCTPTPFAGTQSDNACDIFYTSGTTGQPKGVIHSHFSVLSTALIGMRMMGITSADRILLTTPLYHSASMHFFLMPHMLAGASCVLLPGFQAENVAHTIERKHVTILFAVVPMLHWLLNLPNLQEFDLSSLRMIYTGASTVPHALKLRVMEAFGSDVELVEGYGLTESGPGGTCIYAVDARRKPGSVGQPGPYVRVGIMDDDGRLLGFNNTGEIVMQSPTEMTGYYRDAEATAAAFRGGWLHTGDVGRMDAEGFLYVEDRKQDMIIRGGVNIYPREIEEVLHQHPMISEAAVFGVPDPVMGEEVMACIICQTPGELQPSDIVAYCQTRLAHFKVPRYVAMKTELPRNATGKVLKRQLREDYRMPDARGTRLPLTKSQNEDRVL